MTNPFETRRRARERAVQFLFSIDMTEQDPIAALPGFWQLFPAKKAAQEYAEKLIHGIVARRDELDELIRGAVRNWTFERVGGVEKNILRLALFEMLYRDDVPRAVAINEAIELTKSLGSDESSRFVNGVLDRLKEATASSDNR